MKDAITMFFQYSRVTMKSWFQYRVDALLRSLAVFLREATGIVSIVLVLTKFDINGIISWDVDELVFLYSFLFSTYGILIIFFTGLRDFGKTIQDGTFDRFLLRPRGVLFQIIASDADWFAAVGHGVLGVVLFSYAISRIDVVWNLGNILYLATAFIGGILIQGAIFLFFASLSFYFVKASNVRGALFWNLRNLAGYPLSIFPKMIQCMLMYVVPFAFVNYFPAQYLLRNDDLIYYPEVYLYLTPLIGIAMYLGAYCFWRTAIKHYKSTGN
ncbi:ABC transporter permease [Lachnoclostridium phytofermentans]|uniref:ABC transporter permease n=1 Tax=Lachnoclostridium phytofermentans (strain ATCC 700394 / DSM 18823 / ISDg) TaxID=357809 RepID=A9KM17_LACP7|nr:ABC-2 family transporter protein [Lachnoclostridium phytofermentans]ABX41360.1 protein of unknown function DUF990 [Lachnoclostridium phytofermentans ISDg]